MKLNSKILFYCLCGLVVLTVAAGVVSFIKTGNVNPFFSEKSYKIVLAESLTQSGQSSVEILKDRPEVRFKKWNGEVNMGVSYNKVNASASKQAGSDKVIWKDSKNTSEEVHAYPIDSVTSAKAGIGEDGGFEIEVVLNQKPVENKFDFNIDGAEDLDFLYQPPLNEEYPNRGCSATECKFANHTTSRPENVVGSYAVYHKTKKDHILGQTNYGTGKAYHIYRPKAIDANGKEQWAELHYENGILSVTVPQEFLDAATYPVTVDPTFGYTTAGASADGGPSTWQYYLQLNNLSPAGNNTMTNISFFDNNGDGGNTVKLSLYNESADAPNARQFLDSSTVTIADGWNTNPTPYSYALSANTQYWVGVEVVTTGITVFWDTGGSKDVEGQTGNSPAIAASEVEIATNARPSAYVTYTAAPSAHVNLRGGGASTNPPVKIRGGSSGGGPGAIAQVSGQNTGEQACGALSNLAFPGSVTSGNQIVVTVIAYNGTTNIINTPTKASGTATIGSFSQDKTYENNSGANYLKINVYRASVTGSGSLTIGFSGGWSCAMGVINEYSGMDPSPLDGTPVNNTGTGVTESTGNVVTSTGGMVFMASTELSTADFTYTQSDTNVYNNSAGASSFTAQTQHKITGSANTYNLTAGTGNSWFWVAVGVAYKAAGGVGGNVKFR